MALGPEIHWNVMGRMKDGGRTLTLSRHRNHDDAASDALMRDMRFWDDIWLQPVKKGSRFSIEPPTPPYTVMRDNDHHWWIVDAFGKKVASLLGSVEVKETFVNQLLDMQKAYQEEPA